MFNDELSQRIAQVRSASLGDLLHRSTARVPDRTAVVYRDLRQTYAELDDTVNRTAGALTARGVRKGDRVALLSHNNHAYVVLYFALARLGALSVPIIGDRRGTRRPLPAEPGRVQDAQTHRVRR
jgi:fatty-acyl-CoA synthase